MYSYIMYKKKHRETTANLQDAKQYTHEKDAERHAI